MMFFIDLITPEFLEKVNKLKQQKLDYDQGIDKDDAPFFIRNMYFESELSLELDKCYTLIGNFLEDNEIAFFNVEKQLDKHPLNSIKNYLKTRELRERLKKKREKEEKSRSRSYAQMQKYLESSGISIEEIEKTNTLIATELGLDNFPSVKLDTLRKQSQ